MDSTCVLIGLQVCFHSAMKLENDVSNLIHCLQAVRISKRNKTCYPCLHSLVKTSVKFVKIREQVKTRDTAQGFH